MAIKVKNLLTQREVEEINLEKKLYKKIFNLEIEIEEDNRIVSKMPGLKTFQFGKRYEEKNCIV